MYTRIADIPIYIFVYAYTDIYIYIYIKRERERRTRTRTRTRTRRRNLMETPEFEVEENGREDGDEGKGNEKQTKRIFPPIKNSHS